MTPRTYRDLPPGEIESRGITRTHVAIVEALLPDERGRCRVIEMAAKALAGLPPGHPRRERALSAMTLAAMLRIADTYPSAPRDLLKAGALAVTLLGSALADARRAAELETQAA